MQAEKYWSTSEHFALWMIVVDDFLVRPAMANDRPSAARSNTPRGSKPNRSYYIKSFVKVVKIA